MMRLPRTTGGTRDKVHVILRVERDPEFLDQLVALFSYSITRAMMSLETAPNSNVRLAITRQVIQPLELARGQFCRAILRYGRRPERIVVPAEAVSLADMQLRALCLASEADDFAWTELPRLLSDPEGCRGRLHRALGWRALLEQSASAC